MTTNELLRRLSKIMKWCPAEESQNPMIKDIDGEWVLYEEVLDLILEYVNENL